MHIVFRNVTQQFKCISSFLPKVNSGLNFPRTQREEKHDLKFYKSTFSSVFSLGLGEQLQRVWLKC